MTEVTAQKQETTSSTIKVDITLRGRSYTVACDPAERDKLSQITDLVEEKLNVVAPRGTNNSEVRIFMLACLVLADELIETRKLTAEARESDEELMVTAVNHLKERIMAIAEKVG